MGSQVASAPDYHPFGWEMPGRKYNSQEYRYGFNGKEKDQNGEFGSITNYDYGFRIYNPGIGRFLSVDPLTRDFPTLTPYQFASNRPIDGLDMDGLEYLNYVVNWYEGQAEPEIETVWFNDSQHSEHGWRGRGILFVVNHWEKNSRGLLKLNKEKSSKVYSGRDIPLAEHGFYYGASGLFRITKEGTLFKENDYNYLYETYPPVDGVDYGAFIHDKGYGAVDAEGPYGLFVDWATTPADILAIHAWQVIVDLGIGKIDPYNGQKINKETYDAALRGVKGFKSSSGRKITMISRFISKNRKGLKELGASPDLIDKKGRTNNYKIFVETYFRLDEDGYYIKREGYWETNDQGEAVSGGRPLKPDEIKN